LGDGYGPLLVAREPMTRDQIAGKRIAVPGMMTSAYLVLRLFQPDFIPVVVPFDQIEQAVQKGDVDAGLLIHEGQLTYKDEGLHLVADMGAWWLEKTGLPLPLGGNVIRKDMPRDMQKKVSRHLRESIAYGLDHRKNALDHAMRFARGLDRSKADTFVGMYVNDWTLDYGERGREAFRLFLEEGVKSGVITRPVTVEFIDD
jgi:1,4-dihydroxy-6-naphthoate synthase